MKSKSGPQGLYLYKSKPITFIVLPGYRLIFEASTKHLNYELHTVCNLTDQLKV